MNATTQATFRPFRPETFNGHHASPVGSFEVFRDGPDPDLSGNPRNFTSNGDPVEEGWYWWPCCPGCLPDGEAIGPFSTAEAAYDDAMAAGE